MRDSLLCTLLVQNTFNIHSFIHLVNIYGASTVWLSIVLGTEDPLENLKELIVKEREREADGNVPNPRNYLYAYKNSDH